MLATQYFFRLCVVTVTVPLPSRYLTVTVFGQRSSTLLIVHQRDWSLPQRYPPFINVTSTFINVTQRYPTFINVTQRYSTWLERYPPLLNVIWTLPTVTHRYSTWPQRDLNVTSMWPQCYLRGTFWKNRPLSQIFIFKKNFFPQNVISHAKLR